MEQQSDDEKDRRDADRHADQRGHEPAPFAQLHEPGRDHGAGRYPRSAAVARRTDRRRRVRRRCGDVGRGGHSEAPSRLVTCKNHDSSDACTGCSRYREMPPSTSTRATSAMTSRGVPAGSVIRQPVGPDVDVRADRGAFEQGAGTVGLGALDLQLQRRARQQFARSVPGG